MDTGRATGGRVVFLDWLRVIACFMVMVVHACEPYYFDDDGNTFFGTESAAFWSSLIDSVVRCCVPLFVMASSYLLFPVTRPTGEFLRTDGSTGGLCVRFPTPATGHTCCTCSYLCRQSDSTSSISPLRRRSP